MIWKEFFVVFIGGGLGAALRLLLSRATETILPYDYPWGILVCNVLGSFVIGILAGLFLHRLTPGVLWRSFLIIGILGGFTTFSSFSLDTLLLWRAGTIGLAFTNIVVSVIACIMAVWFGLLITE